MKSMVNMSQGLSYVTDPETGRSYPVPEGAADSGGVSVGDEGGTVQDGGEGSGQQSDGQSSTSGQGFLEPYLADVPEDQRPIVEPVLEKFRKDQDAKVNKRFEELREENKIATSIHQALLQDPVNTLNWIADRFEEEQGIDVRSDLIQRWNDYVQSGQGEEIDQSGQGEENKPLTQADVDRILEEREQQREQEFQRQQREQQMAEQNQRTINGWIDEAAKSTGLPLDDSNGEDPLRPVIIMQANQLYEQGVAKGQVAIEMATEAVAKRFGTKSQNTGNQATQPNLATGGSPPGQEKIDVSDPKQRRARMLEHLTAQNQS